MTCWKTLGWSRGGSDSRNDPALCIQPSPGWQDETYIRAKLHKHRFVNVRLESYALERHTSPKEFWIVMQAFIRAATSRLIGASTTESVITPDDESTRLIAEQMYERCTNWTYTGRRTVWVIHASKPKSGPPKSQHRAPAPSESHSVHSGLRLPLCAVGLKTNADQL